MCISYVIPPIYKCQTNILSKLAGHTVLGNKSEVFLEISSVTNGSSERICTDIQDLL